MNTTIGARIRAARLAKGLRLVDLAEILRLQSETIRRVECDKGGCNMFTFIEIGRVLNVSLEYLAHGNETDYPRK
jgi:transcriptional regulator with XRE-family HTH domain